jgi:hypothetical protein
MIAQVRRWPNQQEVAVRGIHSSGRCAGRDRRRDCDVVGGVANTATVRPCSPIWMAVGRAWDPSSPTPRPT